jgi:Gram-negative bacterial TonB protein C-terminal
MFEEFPRAPSPRPNFLSSPGDSTTSSERGEVTEDALSPRPIVLNTFVGRSSTPSYRWSALFSVLLHVTLIGLTLWLNRKVILPRTEAVAVLYKRPPPPRPPPQPETKPETLKKGSRGIVLPKAVAPEVQPMEELSFAAAVEPEAKGPTGRWVGGVGTGAATGPGWSDGVEGGVVIRRSRARDPQEENTGWPCDFPEQEKDNRLVVRIRVHVNDSGRPTHVTIIRPGPPAFNASAIECAMKERFHPALDTNGNPCEGDREVGILFFRTGHRLDEAAKPPPPPRPPPPPMTGPQPDLPVQLDDSPDPSEKPSGG